MYACMYVHPRGALMGGLLELSFLSSTRSITTTVSEYRYGWPPERYLPSFCGSNLEKAEDTVKVRSKWRPTAIIYLTTRAVIAEQRARKTCFRHGGVPFFYKCYGNYIHTIQVSVAGHWHSATLILGGIFYLMSSMIIQLASFLHGELGFSCMPPSTSTTHLYTTKGYTPDRVHVHHY